MNLLGMVLQQQADLLPNGWETQWMWGCCAGPHWPFIYYITVFVLWGKQFSTHTAESSMKLAFLFYVV